MRIHQLSLLIQSLTQQEKRFFRRQSPAPKTSGGYRWLFEVVDDWLKQLRDQPIEGKALQAHIGALGGPKNLTTLANDLIDKILQTLSQYHQKRSFSSQQYRQLEGVTILFNRALFDLARHEAQSGLKKALNFGDPLITLQWIRWNRRLFQRPELRGKIATNLDQLEEEAVAQITNDHKLSSIYDSLIALEQQKRRLSPEQCKAELDEIATRAQQPKGFWGELAIHASRGIIYKMQSKPLAMQEAFKAHLETWEMNPAQILAHSRLYIAAISNYLSACTNNEEFSTFDREYALIQSNPQLSPASEKALMRTLLNLKIVRHFKEGRYDQAWQVTQDHFPMVFSPDQSAPSLPYNASLAAFLAPPGKENRQFLREITAAPRWKEQPDRHRALQLYDLLLWLEEDWGALSNKLNRFKRKWEKGAPGWVKDILNFVAQWMNTTSQQEQSKLKQQLQQTLEASRSQGAADKGLAEIIEWLQRNP